MTTLNDNDKPLVIIPAAGFGRRVGSPSAKEMFLDIDGKPLIERALNQALLRKWPVHVITREEKIELRAYLQDFSLNQGLNLHVQLISPSREWPDSLLKSEPFWLQNNILCLPDTAYEPPVIWDSLAQSSSALRFAVFQPENFSSWGVVRQNGNQLEICEKPGQDREGQKAWGLSAFTSAAGGDLFRAQLQSSLNHQWVSLPYRADFFELQSFCDLTREMPTQRGIGSKYLSKSSRASI